MIQGLDGASQGPPVPVDYWSMLFVFVLATFIGLGVIRRVSRLLYTPLMSLTNAISAIAVVGSIVVAGADRSEERRVGKECRYRRSSSHVLKKGGYSEGVWNRCAASMV